MNKRKRPPTHPGGILKRLYLAPMEITVSELSQRIGVSRKTVSKLVNERGSVTPNMALRLSRAFNTTPDLWLNLQKNYDLWQTGHKSMDWQRIAPFPAREMATSLPPG